MWVVEKIRVSMESSILPMSTTDFNFKIGEIMFGEKSDKDKKISLFPNVITPDNIPEFCIPPTIPSLQELKNAEHTRTLRATKMSLCEKAEVNAVHHEPLNPHIIQVESVDEGPYDGCSDEETTNADPQSQAALSLPHMAKAQTCYGFCTLLESPHTRRKESLFHEPGSSPLLLPRSRSATCTKVTSPTLSSPSSFSLNALSSRFATRGHCLNWQGALDSDTTSSTESSPFNSPLLTRCPNKSSLFKALSHELLLSRNMRKAMVSRNNSLSTDEGSSTDNSPNVMRRASEDITEGLPSCYSLAPPTIFPMDLTLHKERVMKEKMVPIGKDGSLRLSAEYCSENQRLRVRLISAEGLYPLSVDPKIINCSVSISLAPGKVQKQRSTVIRKSRNPIFNEDFFFDGISEQDINVRSLRFKLVNKMSTLKRDYLLGSCDLPLSTIVTLNH
ncbi:C2 calcium-dependent domain-containing protein 4A [Corythoichthys intestinalis]|uniref:C2 calcium-dependent domain-containing protein 4A n=1 Tax=Corythoichthys intestinalis TaxID=161448 RepID=UPI0025A517F1|nr:C2 calcium-dependent domain-containing protein 4A [Corythoichthys intestinalis]XP_061812521.1 C2 calcium-dependent domain-containing protein 4C-like [Nerophis lumbriciformis]